MSERKRFDNEYCYNQTQCQAMQKDSTQVFYGAMLVRLIRLSNPSGSCMFVDPIASTVVLLTFCSAVLVLWITALTENNRCCYYGIGSVAEVVVKQAIIQVSSCQTC